MSDQVSQEFNTQVIAPSGSGITSINGDGTPAQFIDPSTGILVGNAGNHHAISNDGVLTVAKFGSPGRKGNIVLKPTASVTITEAPNGTYEFAAPLTAGVTSINGDATPAQNLLPGAGIGIVDGGGGNHTISVTAGAGIVSINGDATPAQVVAGINGIDVVDAGATHNISPPGQHNFFASAAGGVAVPNGGLGVDLANHTIGAGQGGQYFVGFCGGVNGIAGQLMNLNLKVNGVFSPLGNVSGVVEIAGQTCQASATAGALLALVPGDVVTVHIFHGGGGAATTSLNASVYGFKVLN